MHRRQRKRDGDAQALPMESPSAASAMLYISLSMILIASFLVLGAIHPTTVERAARTKQSVEKVFREEKRVPLVWPFSLFSAKSAERQSRPVTTPPPRLATRIDSKKFEIMLPSEQIFSAEGELTATGAAFSERLLPFLLRHSGDFQLRVELPQESGGPVESLLAALEVADSLSTFFTERGLPSSGLPIRASTLPGAPSLKLLLEVRQ